MLKLLTVAAFLAALAVTPALADDDDHDHDNSVRSERDYSRDQDGDRPHDIGDPPSGVGSPPSGTGDLPDGGWAGGWGL